MVMPRHPIVLAVRFKFQRAFVQMQGVRPVPPLPTPPLSNAPLVPIKQLQPVTQDIMEISVMHLVKHVRLGPLQILEQVPGQQRVLLVPPVCIPHHRTLLLRDAVGSSTP